MPKDKYPRICSRPRETIVFRVIIVQIFSTAYVENWRRIFILGFSLVLADRCKPKGFSYDLSSQHAQLRR